MVEPQDIAQIAVGGVLSLMALAYGIQKFFKGWREEDATGKVVTLLRTEIDRLSKQNAEIAKELNRFQTEIIGLNKSLIEMSRENARLHAEVKSLTEQITSLQSLLDRRRKTD